MLDGQGGSALQAAPQEIMSDIELPLSNAHDRADERGERQRGEEMASGPVEAR